MRSQGWDCFHFTDVDSKAERGKQPAQSHTAVQRQRQDNGLALSRAPCILDLQRPGWGMAHLPGMGDVVEDGISPFGLWDYPWVSGQGARFPGHMSPQERGVEWEHCQGSRCWLREGERASWKTTQFLEQDPRDSSISGIGQSPRESGIEEGLGWTPHSRSLLFSGRHEEEKVN